MKLQNIGHVDFENEKYDKRGERDPLANKHTPNVIWYMRCRYPTPTNFRQEILTKHYGDDFIDKSKKVLEIGFGCGRNAQFFINETEHIKYYGIDISEVGLKYFMKQDFPEERYYISLDVDDTILSQEYDLIFSTFTLQHIGFKKDKEVYDCVSLTKKLFPLLKLGGYWISYEGHGGDNGWTPKTWYCQSFNEDEVKLWFKQTCSLEGSSNRTDHELYIIEKLNK